MAKKDKKTYYFIKTPSKGKNRKAVIYSAKYSKITKIGSVSWQIGASKGVESEVYRALKDKGLVSKAEYDKLKGYHSIRSSSVLIHEL